MKRSVLLMMCGLAAMGGAQAQNPSPKPTPEPDWKRLSEAEWKRRLTPNQFYILRKAGTEPPFRNAYHDNHQVGEYLCAGCANLLFTSAAKFDSGTGWPSFYRPQSKAAIREVRDPDGERVEVRCARCDGHLGHVFDDATGQWGIPKTPTGLRYCINSGALRFVRRK